MSATGTAARSRTSARAHPRPIKVSTFPNRPVALARKRGLNAQVIEAALALPFRRRNVRCRRVLRGARASLRALGRRHGSSPGSSNRQALHRYGPKHRLLAQSARSGPSWALASRGAGWGDDRSVEEPWRDPYVRFFTPRSMQAMLECAGFAPSPREALTTRISSFGFQRFVGSAGVARPGD
jgi:hypothetical protein